MSLDSVGKVCREFKILRQKSNLNIDYNLGECLKHLMMTKYYQIGCPPDYDDVKSETQ